MADEGTQKIERILDEVERTQKLATRNTYEAELLVERQKATLADARRLLECFTGHYPDVLRQRLAALEERIAPRTHPSVSHVGAFSLNFDTAEDPDAATAAEDELAAAAAQLDKEAKRRKKPKKSKTKPASVGAEAQPEDPPGCSPLPEAPQSGATSANAGVNKDDRNSAANEQSVTALQFVEMMRFDDCRSDEIPCEVTKGGVCMAIPNSAQCSVLLDTEVNYDGSARRCRVEVFRCVLAALEGGEPKRTLPSIATNVSVPELGSGDDDDECDDDGNHEESNDDEGLVATVGSHNCDDTNSSVWRLSAELVAVYGVLQAEVEVEDAARTYSLPARLSARVSGGLRGFTRTVWVILLCHGGSFAGAVFANDRCVIHKVFHRYVVRKKQGGKQSSNAKDVGSYNSAGSQIRAGQELKWRADVRTILLAWRESIEAASIILYAAPGPQNRSVLTDFSALPASIVAGSRNEVSPVDVKDVRVHKVPLTTHRPTFAEVQRIYDVVSRCSVVYGHLAQP